MATEKALGVGLVGCGDIAPAHAKALASTKGIQAGGVHGCGGVVGEEPGRGVRGPWTTRLEELLACGDVDLVTIATPAFTHLPLTLVAAKAGKAVPREKPLAANLQDADAMIVACQEAGVALATCFPLRYLGAAKWAKELIAAGALGEIIEVRLRNLDEKQESYWTGGYSGQDGNRLAEVQASKRGRGDDHEPDPPH